MPYDYLVLIGRFQPLHNGHHAVLTHALRLAKKVIVLTGSAGQPRTIRNPWSASERAVMIRAAVGGEADRLIVRPLRDHLYSETLWVAEVQRLAAEALEADGAAPDAAIGLIGRDKDDTRAYLARTELDGTIVMTPLTETEYLLHGENGRRLHRSLAELNPGESYDQ